MPRALAATVVVILSVAGLRSIVAPARTTVVARASAARGPDQGAEGFAQAFARAYLSWSSDSPGGQAAALRPFLASGLDENGGVQPSASESVSWTAVVGEQASGSHTLVTVAAQTSAGLEYLSVPVARDQHGFLFVSSYPALVGPPASDPSASTPQQQQVNDSTLQTVVARAVTNYLAGNQANLLADLTPNALVSLPIQHMTVTQTQPATWIATGHEVAVQVTATDAHGDSMTLAYQVGVEKLDRWYVQSIQVDPTYEGDSS
jgi:hypothetical protein